jgi:hypothetical protein
MIGLHDLLVTSMLKRGFEFLSKNPRHVEFILCGFKEINPVFDFVGADYFKQAAEFITTQKVHILPYFTYDTERRHSIAVVSSGQESQKFIGDQAAGESVDVLCSPTVYLNFDVSEIEGDTVKISEGYQAEKKLWIGVYISPDQGNTIYTCKGIFAKEGQLTQLFLDREIEAGTSLKGWRAQSDYKKRGYEFGASIDDVTINLNIRTNGDASLHRLVQMSARYIIKNSRQFFEQYGLQDIHISYSPIVNADPEQQIFESGITITGKSTDTWILREYDIADPSDRFDICYEIASTDIKNEPIVGKV